MLNIDTDLQKPVQFSREAAATVALRLKAELGQLIETFPPAARKSSGMARWLGLQVPLCHRIVSAIRNSGDTVEVLTTIAGVAGLEMFIDAARRAGCIKPRIEAAIAAVADFENLIQRSGGSHRKLIDALSTADVHRGIARSGKRQRELRESAFRIACELYGASAETVVNLRVYVPAAQGQQQGHPQGQPQGQLDLHAVTGRIGFERQSSALPVVVGHAVGLPRTGATDSVRGNQSLMDEFCSKPLPRVTTDVRDTTILDVVDPNFEVEGPIDVMAGPYEGRSVVMTVGGRRFINSSMLCGAPSRAALSDVYLPASVASSMICSAAAFQAAGLGYITGDPSKRWFDRLPEKITPGLLGRGIGNAASDHHSKHAEMTRRLFEHIGADPDQFVGFRLETLYPLWSAHYVLSFESVEPSTPAEQ